VFRAAVDDRIIAESPCRSITLPEVQPERVTPLTVEQVQALAAAAEPEWLSAFIVFGAGTGLRFGELLGLQPKHVPFPGRLVTVEQQLRPRGRVTPPKSAASRRVVPVPAFAYAAIGGVIKGRSEGFVFERDGEPISHWACYRAWRKAREKAGLPEGITPHALRHHYASVLIDGGESVKVVQARLGHASAIETLRTYAHLFPSSEDRTRTVVERAWAQTAADSTRTGDDEQRSDQARDA
jgi:integrase